MNLKKYLKNRKMFEKSGVYIFKNGKGKPLYVGRAVNLLRRISQYQTAKDPRIKEMVRKAKSVSVKTTDSALEAVILEANLIKKYWPKYNIRERDDRSFIYILISKTEDFPKPILARESQFNKIKTENFYVFGPYRSQKIVINSLRIIRRIFPYSTCEPFSNKPCFDFQIGLCPGVCVGKISKKDYQKNIRGLILFLEGKKKKLIERLKNENPKKIFYLSHIQDVSLFEEEKPVSATETRIEAYDISHFGGENPYGSMVVFVGSRPSKKDYRLFKIKSAAKSDDLRALGEVILRRLKHKEWRYPDILLVDGGRPQINYIGKVLKKERRKFWIVGISKYQNDKLVFPKGVKKEIKEIFKEIKSILLSARDEAHRFALRANRRKTRRAAIK
jgi:excinuclease ABC subunit C